MIYLFIYFCLLRQEKANILAGIYTANINCCNYNTLHIKFTIILSISHWRINNAMHRRRNRGHYKIKMTAKIKKINENIDYI